MREDANADNLMEDMAVDTVEWWNMIREHDPKQLGTWDKALLS